MELVEFLAQMDTWDLPLVVLILLWDKIKTNGYLRKAVENNTKAINELKIRVK